MTMRIMEHHVLKNVKKPKQQGRTSWKDKDELSGGKGDPIFALMCLNAKEKAWKGEQTNNSSQGRRQLVKSYFRFICIVLNF